MNRRDTLGTDDMEIDLHAHFFNTRSLPIAGVMKHYAGRSRVTAWLLDRFTRWKAADDTSLDRAGDWGTRAGFAGSAPMAAAAPMSEDEAARWIASETPAQWLQSDDFDALFREELAARGPVAAAMAPLSAPTDIESRREQLRQMLSGPGFRAFSIGGAIGGALAFVTDLLRSEKELYEQLAASTRPEVGLFVYHMMDMQKPFGSDPDYHYARFVNRTRRLCQQSVTRGDGRGMVAFVAFDAYRPETIEIVRRALFEQSFVGVKFYPACGYRPDDNAHAERSPEHPDETDTLDERCRDLFEMCAAHDIPIMTHCSQGGMEVVPNRTGKNSNPAHWDRVFATYPDLRVCFGHAGGESDWFNEPGGESWLPKIIELCTTRKNVYLDFSHKEEFFDDVKRARFAARFAASMEAHDAAAYPLRTKVIYGSDYPMLLPGRQSRDAYYRRVHDLFEPGAPLYEFRREVFRDNALRFLNLRKFIDDRGDDLTASQREFLEKVLAPPA